MSIVSRFLGLSVIAILSSCGNEETTVNYSGESASAMDVFHNGIYSVKEGEGEIIGTMTSTYLTYSWRMEGETTILERQLLMDKSKGYHKNSMPIELSYRVPQVAVIADGIKVKSVRGYEQFIPQVVEKLAIKENFKRQLRDARYQLEFDRYEKHRWEMGHLLLGSVPVRGNITGLLKSQGRLPLPAFEVDSVVVVGFKSTDGRKCLEYKTYFRDKESFPYFMWEQYAYSVESGKKYQEFKPDSAFYSTEYMVSLDIETGIPCQEREVKVGTHVMIHPESKERATFTSYITRENLFTKPEKK
jgi:hypothetical protein